MNATRAGWRLGLGRVEVVSAPATEPIDAAYVRAHVNQTLESDDARIELLITAGRRHLERVYGLAFVTQTLAAWWDGAPEARGALLLPRWPVASVTSVTSYGTDDAAAVLATTAYQTDLVSAPARIGLTTGWSWPTGLRDLASIKVVYVAGVATAAVPEDWKLGLAQLVAHWYAVPEAAVLEPGLTATAVPWATAALLAPYRIGAVG